MKKTLKLLALLLIIIPQSIIKAQSDVELNTTEVCTSADGTASLTINGGMAPYTIIWRKYDFIYKDLDGLDQYGFKIFSRVVSDGSNNLDVSNLELGKYNVEIIDKVCSTLLLPFEIVKSKIDFEFELIQPCNDVDGFLDIIIAEDDYPIEIEYKRIFGSGTIEPLKDETCNVGGGCEDQILTATNKPYFLRIELSKNGCARTTKTIYIKPNPIEMNLESSISTCEQFGELNINVSGGLEPFLFNWSNGSSTEDIANLEVGAYTVSVTDDNGCSNEKVFSVDPEDDFEIIRDYEFTSGNTDACDGKNGTISLDIISSVGLDINDYTFEWGEEVNPFFEGKKISAPAGTYEVTVTSLYGCVKTKEYSIQHYSYDVSLDHRTYPDDCVNQQSSLFIETNNPLDCTYEWSDGSTNMDLLDVGPGEYSVTATDERGCLSDNSFTIDEAMFDVALIDIGNNCENNGYVDLSILSGVPPFTTLWSNGQTQTDLINVDAGIYTVEISDSRNCIFTDTYEVPEYNLVSIRDYGGIKNSQTCEDQDGQPLSNGFIDVAVHTQGNVTYQWFLSGQTFSTDQDLDNLEEGVYTLIATYENCTQTLKVELNCCSLVQNNDITVIPNINFEEKYIEIQVLGKGHINWVGPNGFQSSKKNIYNLEYGQYTLTIQNGCEKTVRKFYIIDPAECQSTLEVSAETTCVTPNNSGEIVTEIMNGTPPYRYFWSNGSINQNLIVTDAGTYTITVTDIDGCYSVKSIELHDGNDLNFKVSLSNKAANCEEEMDIEARINDLKGNPPFQIRWGAGPITDEETSPVYQDYRGDFDIYVKIEDACGLTKDATREVNCNLFCSNDRAGFKMTDKVWCFDECGFDAGIEFMCTRVKSYSNHKDDNTRLLSWPISITGDDEYLGSDFVEGLKKIEPRFDWADGRFYYSIKNETNDCKTIKSLRTPPRCKIFKIWDAVKDYYGGGCSGCGNDGEGLDTDGDGVSDSSDNCINTDNPGQEDSDFDGEGDACESSEQDCRECYGGYANPSNQNDCNIFLECSGYDRIVIAENVDCNEVSVPECGDNFQGGTNESFRCSDKFLYMEPLQKNVVNFFFVRKSFDKDSIIGESFTESGKLYRNVNMPLDGDLNLHKVFTFLEFNAILFEDNGNLKLEFYNRINEIIDSTEFQNFDFLSSDKHLDNSFIAINNGLYKKVSIKKDKSISIVDYQISNVTADANKGIEASFSNNALQIVSTSSNISIDLPAGFNVKENYVRNDGTIAVIGEFNGSFEWYSKTYDTNGADNILSMIYKVDGSISNVFLQNSEYNRTIENVSFSIDKFLVAFKEEGSQNSGCTLFEAITLCSNKNNDIVFPVLNFDSITCTMSWDVEIEEGKKLYLEKFIENQWVNEIQLNSIGSKDNVRSGKYRLNLWSPTCPSIYSNPVDVNCDQDCEICEDCNLCPECPDCLDVCLTCDDCALCPWCEDCDDEECNSCTNCVECPDCPECIYLCETCTDCTECPWCEDCVEVDCTTCTDCTECPDCPDCQEDCSTCTDCTQCPDCPDCEVNCAECTDCNLCPDCPDCEQECYDCTDCRYCPWCPGCEPDTTACPELMTFDLDLNEADANVSIFIPVNSVLRARLYTFDGLNWVLASTTNISASGPGVIDFVIALDGNINQDCKLVIECLSCNQDCPPIEHFFDTYDHDTADGGDVTNRLRYVSALSIFPNPSNYSFTADVSVPEAINTIIEVKDVSGKVIFTDEVPLGKGLNRYHFAESSKWSTGVFFVFIKSKDQLMSERIIKVN